MKASELRIGNLVDSDGSILTIAPHHFVDIEKSCASPIQLTEEWLIKFPKDIKGYDYELKNGTLTIWPPDGCTGGHCIEIPCEFVHSFQNIYFDFTGQELTI